MKRATVIEVRPTRPEDGEFFAPCTWIATDSNGIRFGSSSEAEAREMAEQYNTPPRRQRRQLQGDHDGN